MFLIKFKGYKRGEPCGRFAVGKVYFCEAIEDSNFYEITNDNGDVITFSSILHNTIYDFEIVDTKEYVVTPEKPKYMKYFINGVNFGKDEFTEIKRHVSNLKSDGVKCDTIIFEVKFE